MEPSGPWRAAAGPVLNALMEGKVTLGSWTMVPLFIRYPGPF